MNTFPKPLSTKEEQIYLKRMKCGDKDARKILIERNLRLVAHIVKKYSVREADVEDVISIGTIGLIKAIDTFEIDKNYKLATYASRCIENEILMEFRNDKKISKEIFMYDVVRVDNGGKSLSLIDILETTDVDVIDRLYVRDNAICMYEYIGKCLSVREKEILSLRYGLYGRNKLTQNMIAKRLGISRSYVSRIEKKAISKLHREFEKKDKNG